MGKSMILAILLCVAISCSAMPVQATATTEVTVTKYAANNYSLSVNSTTLNYSQMENGFTVQGDGVTHYYHQGPMFGDNFTNDPWNVNENWNYDTRDWGAVNGTNVSDLVDYIKLSGEAKGMNPGDEIQILANDNFKNWFSYTNVYNNRANTTLNNKQGPLVLAWHNANDTNTYESQGLGYPGPNNDPNNNYSVGMRCMFFADTSTNPDGWHVFGDWDMHECLAPWYWHNYTDADGAHPSSSGLSAKWVDRIRIYPPHLHDFNTTGDTTGWAFRYQTSSNPPSAPNDPNTVFTSAQKSNIADDDGTYQSDVTTSNNNYAAHRFNFSIDTSSAKDGPITDIEKLNVTWNGKGWHDSGNNGAYLYIWNGTGYEELDNTTSGAEVYLTGEITSGISNYINSGNVTVLVVQDTVGDDINCSRIATDYIKLVITHHHHN